MSSALDKLSERVAKAPPGAKAGVVAVAAVLVTLLNYFAVGVATFGPSISEVEARAHRADAEQRKLDGELIEKTAIANNLNQFRREKDLLEARLAEALAELPDDKRLDELLQLFQDRASKAGVEIRTIEPGSVSSEGFYARIPIPVEVAGSFHEVATFLDALGRLRRIVNVSDISLDGARDTGGKVNLTGKFLVTTFMFVDRASAEAKDAKAAKVATSGSAR